MKTSSRAAAGRTRALLLAFLLSPGCAPTLEEPAQAPAEDEGGVALLGATVVLDAAERASMDLAFAVPEPVQRVPERRVFGRVESDPRAVAELVAPYGGRLEAGEIALELGRNLEAGALVLWLAPRWSPQESRDRATRAAALEGEVAALETRLPALAAELERARRLNAADKAVSDRDLAQAESDLHEAEARLAAARAERAVLGGTDVSLPLRLPASGEITALLARAGEEVEAGAVLVRVQDFRAPLLALDLPADLALARLAGDARIERGDGRFLAGRVLGLASEAGPGGAAPVLRVRLAEEAPELRPGLQVTAWLALAATAETGVCVPASAVVRLAGRAFVYARSGEEDLERVPLELDRPCAGGWFCDAPWCGPPAPEIVVRGAQNVLSCELLGRQGGEEEE